MAERRKYEVQYKCRLCGKTYIEGGFMEQETKLIKKICDSAHQIESEDGSFPMMTSHYCGSGSFGIADFQGVICKGKENTPIVSRYITHLGEDPNGQ